MHLFTGIQAATLVALWIIKSTSASLIFPLMVSTLSSLFLFVYTNSSNIYPVIMSDNRLQFQINLSLLKRDHIVQVLAMVGFRKAMDYCPSLFSQRDLFYLDRLAIFNSCWNFGNWLKLKKILIVVWCLKRGRKISQREQELEAMRLVENWEYGN